MNKRQLYVGMISGTSMDGIDAVAVSFADRQVDIIATHAQPYPNELRQRLLAAVREPESVDVDVYGELHTWIGECFRDAALAVIETAGLAASHITAIGSHGQTVRHCPDAARPYSLQIGNPAVIATGTGITTVADFRSSDIALSGQGAPLLPPFHDYLLRKAGSDRAVLNLGGIANLTVLPGDDFSVTGFDIGPANTLLDAWARESKGLNYDADGAWAATGSVDQTLLQRLLQDPWFARVPPKSTGLEYFHLDWLRGIGIDGLTAADVQATLAELSAASIAAAVTQWAPATESIFVCGGGAHNSHLMKRLAAQLGKIPVRSTAAAGLDPDWVEACAFAWLAMRALNGEHGNLPAVTGASRDAVLGAIYPA